MVIEEIKRRIGQQVNEEGWKRWRNKSRIGLLVKESIEM